MTRQGHFPRKLLLCLMALMALVSAIDASTYDSGSRERRYVGVPEPSSNNRSDRAHTTASGGFKSSTGKSNNEITAEPGRKVSHRLIGGHLRGDGLRKEPGRTDEALWDDGILMSSAGNGKEGKNARADEDDEKKTLSQQVKEGKYGLIQNEIYGKRPKRPGIISYLGNPEVPRDTADNLGGLDEEEIWLAENHVLVLRGGKFPGHEAGQHGSHQESGQTWPPIDNYHAPRRQVKIPPRPKVPPPFPVQLTEGGPIQIIGPNGTTEIQNNTDYSTDSFYTKGLFPADGAFLAISPNGTIFMPGEEPPKNRTSDSGTTMNGDQVDKKNVEQLPPSGLPPFYHAIPPGAVFVPPPNNHSEDDEEDQSIYYPPPYSFQYKQDNTTAVPPGPLVPGIILPPPPDFFAALDEKKSTTKKYTKTRSSTTPLPRPRPTYLPPRKLTTKQKSSTIVPTVMTKTGSSTTGKSFGRTTYKTTTTGSAMENRQKSIPFLQVTTPTPEKPTTLENTELYSITPVIGNQVSETTTDHKSRGWSGLVSRKTVPVLSYYATTTASSLERPIEVTPAAIKKIVTPSEPSRLPNQASYFFYEESTDDNAATTVTPANQANPESQIYYRTTTTTESPYYKTETQSAQDERKKQFFTVETVPSQEISKDYNVKLIDSLVKDPQVFRYSDDGETPTSPKYDVNSGRTHSQRMMADQPVYYEPISRLPPLAIQQYFTSPRPDPYYQQPEQRLRYGYTQGTKPKPIYQYSFETADYSNKRGGNSQSYYGQQQVSYDYQDIKTPDQQYDYEDRGEPRLQQQLHQQLQLENFPYKNQEPVYPASTIRPTAEVTPNPHHAYFTQQDEKLLDDVTKEYFTIFGKKLTGGKAGVPSTTPIYGKTSSVTERPSYEVNAYVQNDYGIEQSALYKTPNVKVHYGDQAQRPYSLKDDTLVNMKHPLPPINPDSEFITIVDPKHRHREQQQSPLQNYRLRTDDYGVLQNRGEEQLTPIRGATSQRIVQQAASRPPNNFVPIPPDSREEDQQVVYRPTRPFSLLNDTAVNYADPRPPVNPDAEYIDVLPGVDDRPGKTNAYIAYRLPGDGGHFYFLTPQAIEQRQEQSEGYLYPKPRGPRLLRRRRRPGNA